MSVHLAIYTIVPSLYPFANGGNERTARLMAEAYPQ